MAAKGNSKKSKKGGKAKKSSKAAFKKQKASGGLPDPADEAAARKRNPRAFVNATRGKTIKLNARKAERDQRRMHGDDNMQCACTQRTCMTFATPGTLLMSNQST